MRNKCEKCKLEVKAFQRGSVVFNSSCAQGSYIHKVYYSVIEAVLLFCSRWSQGVDLTVARPTFFVSWRLIRRKFVLQRFILTTVH